MKKIFTFAIALMSLLAVNAANVTFTVTVPQDPANPTTNTTNECWMVGSFQGWNIDAAVQMTKVDNTHYTVTLDDATFIVYNGVQVTRDNMEYKYSSGLGGGWAYIEKNADGSERGNHMYADFNGVDVVARWALTFVPHTPQPMNVTIDVLVPAGTIQCYIVGNFNGWAGPTAPADSCKMVKVSDFPDGTMLFEKTIFTSDAVLLAYHFCSGPDWSYEQADPTGDYKYPLVQPIVNSWKKIYDPSKVGNLTINATVPAGTTDVWAQGSWIGWNFVSAGGVGGQKCTKNADGTFSFTANLVLSIEYKMYNGQSWANEEANADGSSLTANRSAVYPTDNNTSITVAAWKIPSALKELDANKYKVYTNGQTIVVEGVNSQVEVYDASGRTMQSVKTMGTFTSRNMNAGLYILKVDGATRKVALN